jgi:TolB-like protein/Tfp pilus assembly protein PilF
MVNRKLVAILAADMAGYSRLMGADEEGTLARLKARLGDIIEPAMAQHRGRIVKTTGDGLLAEFASVVDAVRCAVAMQQAMAKSDAGVADDRRIAFRVGVNLGDVIAEGGDIFGDGVNVAARLQGLAEPGGICVSGIVHDQVQDKLDIAFDDLGDNSVKNIARPVRAYRLRLTPRAAPAAIAAGGPPPLPDKPSIAVLPFENMSGDPEQAYFSDGIAEDVITDLSKISGLFVIARNSAFVYRGKAVEIRRVASELGVRYVLEGSVRKAGNRVRVTAQLIDGLSGGHLWGERYDRDLTDIFAVQDEVTQHIVSALSLKLTRDERQRLARKGTENLEAYDCYLKGRELHWQITRESMAQAKPMFERAIALDPGFAAAYANLARCLNIEYLNGWSESPEASQRRAYELALKAVSADAAEPLGHYSLGIVRLWRKEFDPAIAAHEKAIALDPNFAPSYASLGLILHYTGRSAESLDLIATAMRLDPHYPDLYLHFVGQAYFALGRYEEAAAALKRRLVRNPNTDVSRVLLAACYGQLGQTDAARAEWREALKVNPAYSLEQRRRILPYKDPRDFERVVEGLRKAGLPD